MDFTEGVPKSKGKDVILVVANRLTKYSHLLTLSHPFTTYQVSQLCMHNIHKLHGFPKAIMTHKYRGSIVVLSINKSVKPNKLQKVLACRFVQGFTANINRQVFMGFIVTNK